MLVDNIKTQQSTSEEEDRSQEGESKISLELVTRSAFRKTVPVPDRTAGATKVLLHISIELLDGGRRTNIGEKTESNHESNEEEEIYWPMDERASEGEQED